MGLQRSYETLYLTHQHIDSMEIKVMIFTIKYFYALQYKKYQGCIF